MIDNSKKLNGRLLGAVLLSLAAGCSVSASGQIPCADDSSCPADYPVCSAGKCIEGTSSTAVASVSILGVQGKAATDEVRGTVVVTVSAHANSGVKSISLTGGGQVYSPNASSSNGIYTFTVDTTKLNDGDVPLTATLTPGDPAVASKTSNFTLHVYNAAPSALLVFTNAAGTANLGIAISANPHDTVYLLPTFGGSSALLNGAAVTSASVVSVANLSQTTSFTLLVTNPAGTTSTAVATATVNAVVQSFSVSPLFATTGISTLFTFTSSHEGGGVSGLAAGTITGTGIATGLPIASGAGAQATLTTALSSDTPYTLTVNNSAGTAESPLATAHVTAVAPAVATSLITGNATNAITITNGTSTSLTPTFTNDSGGTAIIQAGSATVASGLTSGTLVTVGPIATTTYTLVVTNRAGMVDNSQTATVTVAAPPAQPSITTATTVTTGTSSTATVPAHAGFTYFWTISAGTFGTGGTAGVTSSGTNTMTYTAGPVGNTVITCQEVNAANTKSGKAIADVTVIVAPSQPTVTAAANVTVSSTGNVASVVANAGMTYCWTVSGATITAGGSGTGGGSNCANGPGTTTNGVNSIIYTAAASGSVSLSVTEHNAAGAISTAGTASPTIVAAPTIETITAGSNGYITTGTTPGASVPTVTGTTHNWTINGGTISTAMPSDSISFSITAGVGGTVTLNCTETNLAGTSQACTSKTLTVAAAPSQPTITTVVNGVSATAVVASTSNQASVTAHANMTYNWTVNSATTLITGGQGTATITYTAPASGSAALSVTEVNLASVASASGAKSMAVVSSGANTPSITVASTVTAGTSNSATVAGYTGETYNWTTSSNAAITAGQSTSSLTFDAGVAGTDINLNVTATQISTGSQAVASQAVVHVAAVPSTPAIVLSAANVTTAQTGLTAQVTANTGMSYCWTATNATITTGGSGTGGGTNCANGQGVTATGHNTITYTAGSAGTPVTVSCQEVNAANLASAPNTVSQDVFADVATPTINTAANVGASSTGNMASIVTPHTGMTYNWQVNGGTSLITAGQGTDIIAYTAPTAGTTSFTVTATEQNGAGKTSSGGSATVNNLTPPGQPSIASLSPSSGSVGNKDTGRTANVTSTTTGLTFTWAIIGAGITAGQGTSTVTYTVTAPAGGQVSITATAVNVAGQTSSASTALNIAVASGSYSTATDLAVARIGATVTQLSDGRVLITGGAPTATGTPTSTAVICNSLGESCAATNNNMATGRMNHTATLLSGSLAGKVLIAGGYTAAGPATPTNSAEILDPTANSGAGHFSPVSGGPGNGCGGGVMSGSRAAHIAVPINDTLNLVLVAGGTSNGSTALSSAEVFDPAATGTTCAFTALNNSMKEPRMNFAGVLLNTTSPSTALLIGSGTDGFAEVFSDAKQTTTANVVANATFTTTSGALNTVTTNLTATWLNSTTVLIVGGHSGSAPTSTSYLYTIGTTGIAATGSLGTARESHTATQLIDGRVLIAGGTINDTGPVLTATSEAYAADGSAASVTGSMSNARSQHAATILQGGAVLMVGGLAGTSGSKEVYLP